MHDNAISQAEIDALVKGMTGESQSPAPAAHGQDDAGLLQEPLRAFAQEAGRALSDLVGTPCQGSLSSVSFTTADGVMGMMTGEIVVGRTALTSGMPYTLYYLVPVSTGLAMVTQIYGGVAPSALDDSALSALADGLTQMNQCGLTRLSDLLGRPVFGGPMEAMPAASLAQVVGGSTPVAAVAIDLLLGDESGRILLVLPQEFADMLAKGARSKAESGAGTGVAAGGGAPRAAGIADAYLVQQPSPATAARQQAAAATLAPVAQPMVHQAAAFPELSARPAREESRNIDLLLDVSLQVTVELGRTRRQIRDVLSLGPGSVLELDKLAGEQVDVLVNGKLIAKGEVVVIDENYGVRITDIISPVERVQSLK